MISWWKLKKQKAETETETMRRYIFFFKSKIRACGGGRYGRADMIQRGQRDVMQGSSWRSEPLMIPLGTESHRQQMMRRDFTVLIRWGRSNSLVSCSQQRGISRHLICFLWPFSTSAASPTLSSGQEISTNSPEALWTQCAGAGEYECYHLYDSLGNSDGLSTNNNTNGS